MEALNNTAPGRLVGWAIAVWTILTSVAFLASVLLQNRRAVELVFAARYVYAVVLLICVALTLVGRARSYQGF